MPVNPALRLIALCLLLIAAPVRAEHDTDASLVPRTPAERLAWRERLRQAAPEERRALIAAQREALRERWRQASPEERARMREIFRDELFRHRPRAAAAPAWRPGWRPMPGGPRDEGVESGGRDDAGAQHPSRPPNGPSRFSDGQALDFTGTGFGLGYERRRPPRAAPNADAALRPDRSHVMPPLAPPYGGWGARRAQEP